MLFNSYVFVFVFLPCVMFLWYGLNRLGWHKLAQIALAGLSLVFYGYGHPEYLIVILSSVAGNWCISALMAVREKNMRKEDPCGNQYVQTIPKKPEDENKSGIRYVEHVTETGQKKPENGKNIAAQKRIRIFLGIIGIIFNVGLLFYFKYYDFFVFNVNRVTGAGLELKHIALPLGISFFTFQQISFMADRMMGKAGHYKILDYINYVTFFPQLVAGPIVNHKDLVPQFQKIADNRQVSRKGNMVCERLEKGLALFVVGLAKKVLLADKLGGVVDIAYADVAGLDTASAFVVMLAYTFQIYFDFSGYCDMAVGLGWILGIELPKNFDSPYKSKSVTEFWRRWHMTLNAFFVQYIYIPLGGSRKGMLQKLRNTMIVFLISGIWHGAAWTFVVWGVAHGCMICLENIVEKRTPNRHKKRNANDSTVRRKSFEKLHWFVTFSFVNLAWVLFRSGSLSQALLFYRKLFSFLWTGKLWEIAESLAASWNYPGLLIFQQIWGTGTERYYYLFLSGLLLLVAGLLCMGKNAYEWIETKESGAGRMWLLAFLFMLCVISFSGVTTFLYFNF